jgi:ABC-type anion transport system duplicated permease subunit
MLVVSILQLILLGLCGFVASVPEAIQQYFLDQDSWIAWLALECTMLTVLVSMAVGCALGVYTGVLGRKGNSHHEGIQPVVRSLAAFLQHVAHPPTMLCVSLCGTE